ncbi:hypothetical protein [Sphingosinicella sp.]|uniref:hypothetical protein n=1 Tax=Sphingosinicella sp. TaxID=1917971 RepID=UPI004037BD60
MTFDIVARSLIVIATVAATCALFFFSIMLLGAAGGGCGGCSEGTGLFVLALWAGLQLAVLLAARLCWRRLDRIWDG